jgi:hydroxypyruvate reductase/glycerate 2-kinase
MIENFESLAENTSREFFEIRKDLLEILDYVLEEMNSYNLLKKITRKEGEKIYIGEEKIDIRKYKRIFLTGFGKASGSMAKAIEEIIDFDEECIITTEDINLKKAIVFKGTHPWPSEINLKATEKIIDIFERANEDDLIIVLISGGGSSLLCKPKISLEGMIEITEELMKKGCTIEELNVVRKHLSHVKGGKLAKMTKASILSLIISDIIGNPVELIASGPTSPDSSSAKEAMKIIEKYGIKNKEAIEALKKDEKISKLENVKNIIVADNEMACKKALEKAVEKGYYGKIFTNRLKGEARAVGKDLGKFAKIYPRNRAILIFGGETTVKVKGNGTGGRNQEIVLSAIEEIKDEEIAFISFGTDGIDGNSPAGGAIADGNSYGKAMEKKLIIEEFLEENNSYEFFRILGDVIITGYTGTNVMDIQLIGKI